MRALSIFAMVVIIVISFVDHINFHNRNMMMAENAFATGCSAHAILRCSQEDKVLVRGSCYEDAYENCPKWGVAFREGLEAAGK